MDDFISERNQLYDEKIQLEEENHLILMENARLQEEVNFLNTKIKLLEELLPEAVYEVAQMAPKCLKEFIDVKSHSFVSDDRYSPLKCL